MTDLSTRMLNLGRRARAAAVALRDAPAAARTRLAAIASRRGLTPLPSATNFVTLDCGKRWIAEGKRASVVSILTTWVWNGGPYTVPSAMSKAGLATMSQ